ncbi:mastermind-like protein 3, partial [Clarias magur]
MRISVHKDRAELPAEDQLLIKEHFHFTRPPEAGPGQGSERRVRTGAGTGPGAGVRIGAEEALSKLPRESALVAAAARMMMGDYSGPAASTGGVCINSGGNVSLSAGSNSTTPGNCSGGGGGGGGGGAGPGAGVGAGVPKHSTVVERLRQRIEGCRRHHSACEARFQQAHAEQLELERRETAALYQRTLEHRAKKGKQQQQQQQQSKQQDQSESSEQRNNTLIA